MESDSFFAMPIDLTGRLRPTTLRPTAGLPRARTWTHPVTLTGLVAVALALMALGPRAALAAEPSASGAARAAAAGGQRVSGDPMDQLRAKLAERLGAQKPAEAGSDVMRVDNRTAPAASRGASPGPARVAARPTAAGRAPSAAPTQPAPAASMASRRLIDVHGHPHWEYGGEFGPEAWGRLAPEYAKCASGQRQSPIDIRDGIAVQLDPIQFDYRKSAFSVQDNGHTVMVSLPPGQSITILGRRYELKQFHFHLPSEERINGRQFDMVAHLVHQDAEGRLAVVAVLLQRGAAQPVIQAVWNALPLEKGEDQPAMAAIDLNQLLPEDRRYYTYMGSLTTPPCTEGVLWMVLKTPVTVSPEQVQIFSRLYPMNARPVQQTSGRLIKESD